MKAIPSSLLLTFLSFLYIKRAGGSPGHLDSGEAYVQLHYGFAFGGYVITSNRERDINNEWFLHIPTWMQPNGEVANPKGLSFFIRTDFGEHFESRLDPTNHIELESYPSIPELAQVRIRDNVYTTVGHFKFYNPQKPHYLRSPNFPDLNHLYVIMPGGPH